MLLKIPLLVNALEKFLSVVELTVEKEAEKKNTPIAVARQVQVLGTSA
jgi:hypothetical protein